MMNVFHGKVIFKKKIKKRLWRINFHSLIVFLPVSQALSESRIVDVGGTCGLRSSTCVSLDEM